MASPNNSAAAAAAAATTTMDSPSQQRPFSTTVDNVLHIMKLMEPEDSYMYMLPQLLHWVKTQRPNYMYTTVLSLTVLLMRLARAFSMRSTVGPSSNSSSATGKAIVKPKDASSTAGTTATPVAGSTTAATATSTVTSTTPTSTTPTSTIPTSTIPTSTTPTTSTTDQAAAPAADATTPQKPQQQQPSKRPRKSFRSAKKLDLSPNVVESLKDFVADLAAAIPLILKHAEYEQGLHPQKPGIYVPQRAPTAVDIVDVCLELLEGGVTSDAMMSGREDKSSPNAAMELFRTVLAPKKSNTAINKEEEVASAMDQLKFKTFCVKTLESAQTRTVHLVEAFYDFRLLWNVAHEQHSVVFVPTTTTSLTSLPADDGSTTTKYTSTTSSALQEDMAWKFSCYLVWKHQEESPQMCSRRQRILAGVTSMVLLSLVPLFHRHPQAVKPAETAPADSAATAPAAATDAAATTTTTTTTPDAATDAAATTTPAAATDAAAATSAAPSSDPNSNNKRPMEDSAAASPAQDAEAKSRKIAAPVAVAPKVQAIPGFPYGSCDRCAQQERTRHIVMHAARQASAFLTWASIADHTKHTSSSASETDITRVEVDRELLKVALTLATFSSDSSTDNISTPDSWIDVLKTAIGVKDDENDSLTTPVEAEQKLLELIDKAFKGMTRDENDRRGTRVEAVSYVNEMELMHKVSRDHIDYLCQATTNRQKKRNELIARIPETAVPTPQRLAEIKKSYSFPKNKQGSNSKSSMDEGSNPLINQNRAVSPPVMTEPMELNEWTIAVLSSLTAIGPSSSLVQRLNHLILEPQPGEVVSSTWQAVVVPVLNRFIDRMPVAVGDGNMGSMPPMKVGPDGVARSTHRTLDTQLGAAIIQLYYHSLESILYYEQGANAKLILSDAFHEGLLACCYLCVARAVIITGKMQLVHPENHQIYTIMPITGCTPYTYLKVAESFMRAMTITVKDDESSKQLTETFGTLPRVLQKEIKNSEVFVIESLVWARDSPSTMAEGYIVRAISELKHEGKQWPPKCLEPSLPEELEDMDATSKIQDTQPQHAELAFVSFIMRKLLKIAYFRIQSICEMLEIPIEYPVISQIWLAFRFLLRSHVELLYGRHIDQWILCTVYGICKVMKYEPDLTFARIIEVYVAVRGRDLGERTCQAIVRHVKILDGGGDGEDAGATKIGNIIRLYNIVFVPIMKSYLLKSKALRRNAASLKEAMARTKLTASAKPTTVTPNSKPNATTSVPVRQGNVSVQLTLGGGGKGSTTASMMLDQKQNDITMDDVPGAYPAEGPGTFLQFGRVSGSNRVSLANEMIAQAANPSQ